MSSKKKITFLISSLSSGGAEGVCVGLANKFVENNWLVDLVILNLKNDAYIDHLSSKVNLVVLNINHVRYSFLSILKYIKKNKTKVIMVFNYELSVVSIILKKIFKLRI